MIMNLVKTKVFQKLPLMECSYDIAFKFIITQKFKLLRYYLPKDTKDKTVQIQRSFKSFHFQVQRMIRVRGGSLRKFDYFKS